ncbi:MAG: hypothetical protein HY520_04135 [Candidatus Aenigmarchaeota archaeon]|nr:hypothetical protein [Candidatus Aenigmarchaeota archaeon]
MPRLVLVEGKTGAGKSTITKYLKRCGYARHSIDDYIREHFLDLLCEGGVGKITRLLPFGREGGMKVWTRFYAGIGGQISYTPEEVESAFFAYQSETNLSDEERLYINLWKMIRKRDARYTLDTALPLFGKHLKGKILSPEERIHIGYALFNAYLGERDKSLSEGEDVALDALVEPMVRAHCLNVPDTGGEPVQKYLIRLEADNDVAERRKINDGMDPEKAKKRVRRELDYSVPKIRGLVIQSYQNNDDDLKKTCGDLRRLLELPAPL